jgi:hypothetical protein
MKTSDRELAEAERAVARYCVTATPLAGVWRGGQYSVDGGPARRVAFGAGRGGRPRDDVTGAT